MSLFLCARRAWPTVGSHKYLVTRRASVVRPRLPTGHILQGDTEALLEETLELGPAPPC